MQVFQGIAELEKAVGAHLGYSGWHTVTQEQITLFADATGDHQWIHVDPERAASTPFGTTIAHGFLTLSLLPKLSRTAGVAVSGHTNAVNYGAEGLRFLSPVPSGSPPRCSNSPPRRT